MNKVLVVDDAAFMRLTIRTMLHKNGYEVVGEAADGKEGVRKYKETNPDIVTMDITMPEMSGIEALKSIREFDPKAKVLIMSAMGQEAMVKEAIAAGASSVVVKPFKEDHVIQVMNKMTGK